MNFARVGIAAIAAWVVSIPVGFVVNSILLKDVYAANMAALRPESQLMANLPLGFAGSLFAFFVFAYAYAKGYEGGQGPMEGVRYGVIVALMINGFAMVWNYVTLPISGAMIVAQMIDVVAEFALYGGIVGAIYKPIAAPAREPAAV